MIHFKRLGTIQSTSGDSYILEADYVTLNKSHKYSYSTIIPKDAIVLTEAEYQAELARLQPDTSTPTK